MALGCDIRGRFDRKADSLAHQQLTSGCVRALHEVTSAREARRCDSLFIDAEMMRRRRTVVPGARAAGRRRSVPMTAMPLVKTVRLEVGRDTRGFLDNERSRASLARGRRKTGRDGEREGRGKEGERGRLSRGKSKSIESRDARTTRAGKSGSTSQSLLPASRFQSVGEKQR